MSAPAHLPERRPGTGAPAWPRLPASFVAGAVVLVAAAGLAGWVGRGLSADAPLPAPPQTVELGPVALSVPGDWVPSRPPAAGLGALTPPAATFAPVPGLSARAVVTLAPSGDPSLLPEPLRTLAGTARPRRIVLAGLPAWRYRALEIDAGRMAQATVAPTTAGSVTVVCVAPAATWSGAAGCEESLAGASLRGAAPLVPSHTLAFRRALGPVVHRLGDRRAELRRRLRTAPTGRAQARLAAGLERAHLRAVAALEPSTPAAGAPRRLVRTLRAAARGYRRLTVAARKGWPVRYRRARAEVRRADRALARIG